MYILTKENDPEKIQGVPKRVTHKHMESMTKQGHHYHHYHGFYHELGILSIPLISRIHSSGQSSLTSTVSKLIPKNLVGTIWCATLHSFRNHSDTPKTHFRHTPYPLQICPPPTSNTPCNHSDTPNTHFGHTPRALQSHPIATPDTTQSCLHCSP